MQKESKIEMCTLLPFAFLLLLVLASSSCKKKEARVVLRVMRDSRGDIAAWVDRAVWEFNRNELRTPRGRKILVATYEVVFKKRLPR